MFGGHLAIVIVAWLDYMGRTQAQICKKKNYYLCCIFRYFLESWQFSFHPVFSVCNFRSSNWSQWHTCTIHFLALADYINHKCYISVQGFDALKSGYGVDAYALRWVLIWIIWRWSPIQITSDILTKHIYSSIVAFFG